MDLPATQELLEALERREGQDRWVPRGILEIREYQDHQG